MNQSIVLKSVKNYTEIIFAGFVVRNCIKALVIWETPNTENDFWRDSTRLTKYRTYSMGFAQDIIVLFFANPVFAGNYIADVMQ